MTVIKLIILTLFMSCGNNVKLIDNKLENLSAVTSKEFQKTGALTKGQPSSIQTSGKTYNISNYSSKSAFDFINSVSSGTTINVVYTGGIIGNEIVIETIKQQ